MTQARLDGDQGTEVMEIALDEKGVPQIKGYISPGENGHFNSSQGHFFQTYCSEAARRDLPADIKAKFYSKLGMK